MEGGRRWEDLNEDCLANVFGRVGLESLLLDVPFVCKSWYKATQIPQCWERLVFPELDPEPGIYRSFVSRLKYEYQVDSRVSSTAIIKFVVKRSARCTTLLALPYVTTVEALTCVADGCPALKTLLLHDLPPYHDLTLNIPSLVNKWTRLEILSLPSSYNMIEILAQISIHCKNFVGLMVPRADIGEDEASALVTSLPNIQYLILREAFLERKNLLTILKGCKELVELDVRDCSGFEGDDEILKLASNIRKFMFEGSVIKHEFLIPDDLILPLIDFDFDFDDLFD